MRNFWFRLLSAPLPFPFSPPPLHPVYGLKGVGLTDAVHFFMKPWAMTTGAHDARRASQKNPPRDPPRDQAQLEKSPTPYLPAALLRRRAVGRPGGSPTGMDGLSRCPEKEGSRGRMGSSV